MKDSLVSMLDFEKRTATEEGRVPDTFCCFVPSPGVWGPPTDLSTHSTYHVDWSMLVSMAFPLLPVKAVEHSTDHSQSFRKGDSLVGARNAVLGT